MTEYSCVSVPQELFVEMIAKDALVYAQQGKRKTLQRKDLGKRCKETLNAVCKYVQTYWAFQLFS